MEIKDLQERITKKQNQIAKIERRVAKWMNQSSKEEIKLFEETKQMTYRQIHEQQIQLNSNVEELRRAVGDLEDAKATLKKYEEALAIEVNKENEEKIEVLVNFLSNWKEEANRYYHQEAVQLYNEYQEHKMIDDKLKAEHDYSEYRKLSIVEYNRYNKVVNSHSSVVRSLRQYREPYIDEAVLEKVLTKEVKRKYQDLVNRISKVVGEIQDCNNLRIAGNGSINGYVTGSKCKARVETITAGGYNIQCLHYRVLVNKIN